MNPVLGSGSELAPVVICGAPRSGTTALVRLLNQNGCLVTNEWGVLAPVGDDYMAFLRDKATYMATADLADWFATGSGIHLSIEDCDEGGAFAGVLHGIYGREPFWGDKWTYERDIDAVLRNFPAARVIYIHRDPRQVAASLVKGQFVDDVAAGLAVWRESVLAWMGWESRVDHCVIRQRDLFCDQESVMTQLTSFLGAPIRHGLSYDATYETWREYSRRQELNIDFFSLVGDSAIDPQTVGLARECGYSIA